eukprot:6588325-Karenia_brevis.AAC.1
MRNMKSAELTSSAFMQQQHEQQIEQAPNGDMTYVCNEKIEEWQRMWMYICHTQAAATPSEKN